MQSLNNAADSLLKSASRLEEEIGKETKYWNSVLAVKDKGWSLSRLPREKHTLGIRYGFAEGETAIYNRASLLDYSNDKTQRTLTSEIEVLQL